MKLKVAWHMPRLPRTPDRRRASGKRMGARQAPASVRRFVPRHRRMGDAFERRAYGMSHFQRLLSQAKRDTLVVALQTGNGKMSYYVPEGLAEFADRAGHVPFLCRQIAEDLGLTLVFVFYDVAEQQLEFAQNGEVDFPANVWSITEKRLERFAMTDNILVTGIEGDEAFLRADPEQPGSPVIDSEEALAAARIGAVRATVQAANAQIQHSEAEVLADDGNDAVPDALLAGEVDAAVFTTFDRAFADLLVEDIMGQLICQCEYQIVNPEIKGVGFVLMKGNDDLCDYLNERLAQYRSSGQLQEWNDLNETEAKAMGII